MIGPGAAAQAVAHPKTTRNLLIIAAVIVLVVPVALVAAAVTGVCARVVLHAMMSGEPNMFRRDLALMPVRDVLLFAQWMAGSFGSTVVWRGVRMPVEDTDSRAGVFRHEPAKAFEVSDGR